VYAADSPAPAFFDAITSKDRRGIMSDAVAFARDFRPAGRARFDVTALCRDGAVEWVFVIDRKADRALRHRWRALVKEANLRASDRTDIVGGSSTTYGTPRIASVRPA
jgi:hypothetical protein